MSQSEEVDVMESELQEEEENALGPLNINKLSVSCKKRPVVNAS